MKELFEHCLERKSEDQLSATAYGGLIGGKQTGVLSR